MLSLNVELPPPEYLRKFGLDLPWVEAEPELKPTSAESLLPCWRLGSLFFYPPLRRHSWYFRQRNFDLTLWFVP